MDRFHQSPNTWPLILMYHGVISQTMGIDINALGLLDQNAFERQLRWLKRHYRVLHADEFADALAEGKPLPERSVLVTLDDGFQNVLEYALPVAETLDIPLLAFISTAHLDRREWLWFSRWRALQLIRGREISLPFVELARLPISEIEMRLDKIGAPRRAESSPLLQHLFDGMDTGEMIRAVERGYLTVGGHTVQHPDLTNESSEVCHQEIFENKRELERIAGKPVRLFAYPHGTYNQQITREVHQAGYVGAFIVGQANPVLSDETRVYQIPRTGINRDGLAYFWWRVIGAGAWLRSHLPLSRLEGVMP